MGTILIMNKPITTTLRKIHAAGACTDQYLLGCRAIVKRYGSIKKFGVDSPITLAQIIKTNGLNEALWCLQTLPEHDSLRRHFAVDCAEQIKDRMTDGRSLHALIVARNQLLGKATDEELAAAWAAASDAAWAAERAAERAAESAAASDAASDAVWAAERAAESDAARAAERAAAGAAARAAAWAAAGAAAREWQSRRLEYLTNQGYWTPVAKIDALDLRHNLANPIT